MDWETREDGDTLLAYFNEAKETRTKTHESIHKQSKNYTFKASFKPSSSLIQESLTNEMMAATVSVWRGK